MKNQTNLIKVALADDHVLLRNALATLVDNFGNCKVILQESNGFNLTHQVNDSLKPDVAILDLNMPEMDGLETAAWFQRNFPDVRVLILTMYDSELALVRLLKAGVRGFLKKDVHPSELKFAIQSVVEAGYYYSNHTTGKLVNLFRNNSSNSLTLDNAMLTDQEIAFLRLACTDMTYKEIALQLHLNPRTIDALRDALFTRLDVKSRVGLAMFAIRHGVVRF